MTVTRRIIRIEEYLRRKRGPIDWTQENPMSLVVALRSCLERGDEEGLKKYPPWLVEKAKETIAEKRAREIKPVGKKEKE